MISTEAAHFGAAEGLAESPAALGLPPETLAALTDAARQQADAAPMSSVTAKPRNAVEPAYADATRGRSGNHAGQPGNNAGRPGDRAVVAPSLRFPTLHGPVVRNLHELATAAQIGFAVRRERARVDRRGGGFSLAIFQLNGKTVSRRRLLRLARLVCQEARMTDEVGYFDRQTICVVMPDTESKGAWRLADRVCQDAEARKLNAHCHVYLYPFKEDEDNEEHCGDTRSLSWPEQGDAAASPMARVTRSLEPMLVRRTPFWKRVFDCTCALAGLAVAGLPMLAIAAAIKLDSPGPVLFLQNRRGLGGSVFAIWKFRTMYIDAEARKAALQHLSEQDGPAFKLKDDPRITRVGRLLRKTSLDELPQLVNVLLGEMSLVGPRPLPVKEQDAAEAWHQRRLDVAPGLTCIWQVEGRSRVTFEQWMRMDLNYMRRRQWWADAVILLKTIPAVLARRGAA